MRSTVRGLGLAVVGGVVFALTSPPTDLYPAVVVGLALLAAALSDAPTAWRALGRGAAWATAAGIVGLRFVPSVIQRFTSLGVAASILALVLLAAAQSLIWAIGAAVTHTLRARARAPLELAFACGVFVAVCIPTVFLWTPAGLVSPWPVFVQLADVVGERGVSAIFAVAAALLARAGLAAFGVSVDSGAPVEPALRRRAALLPALAALGIFAALGIHGAWRMRDIARASAELPTLRVALINHAVGPHERWEAKNHPSILRRLRALTQKAEADGAELTIWPEAAYPYALDHATTHAPRGEHAIVGRGVRGPVLVGLITRARPVIVEPGVTERNSYNSATLVSPSGEMQPPYDKLELLWFGEMVPGGRHLPWLRRLFQRSGGLVPGDAPRALVMDREDGARVPMGILNCYEDTLPGVGRLIARALSPALLVNVTNDAWFFGTAEPELHARLATMRAVELRLDLVRAVNMGVVSWIDASGAVRARYAGAEQAVIPAAPSMREGTTTLYARFGEMPALLLLGLVVAGYGWRRRAFVRRSQNEATESGAMR